MLEEYLVHDGDHVRAAVVHAAARAARLRVPFGAAAQGGAGEVGRGRQDLSVKEGHPDDPLRREVARHPHDHHQIRDAVRRESEWEKK